MIFTPGLTTLVLLILAYGYTAQNHLYMKVWRKHNWTKHIPSGLNTKELLTALLANLVLLCTKEFLKWNTTIYIHFDKVPLVENLISFSSSPPPWSFAMQIIPDCFCYPFHDLLPGSLRDALGFFIGTTSGKREEEKTRYIYTHKEQQQKHEEDELW